MSKNDCLRWVTADLHFMHYNNAVRRGFSSCEEHDELVIKNWNSVVKPNHIVYILGDISMEKKKPYPLLDRMNGIKYVTLGNHERRQDVKALMEHVQGVAACFSYKNCLLTHIPVHPNQLIRYRKNIHGHQHEKKTWIKVGHRSYPDPRYKCISLDQNNMFPFLLDDLVK